MITNRNRDLITLELFLYLVIINDNKIADVHRIKRVWEFQGFGWEFSEIFNISLFVAVDLVVET